MDTFVESKAVVKTPAYAAQSAKSPLAPGLSSAGNHAPTMC